jgi:hypothetical protein
MWCRDHLKGIAVKKTTSPETITIVNNALDFERKRLQARSDRAMAMKKGWRPATVSVWRKGGRLGALDELAPIICAYCQDRATQGTEPTP